MALSISLAILLSLGADWLLRRIRLPGLMGMLIVGVVLGQHGLKLLSPALLSVSADFRRIALIVILLRAGLQVTRSALRQVGRPVALMALLPATLEAAVVALLAPHVLGLAVPEALLLGVVLAAVGPAVTVPAMIGLQCQGRGTDKRIPTLILAASPLDNVYVLVLFSTLQAGEQAGYASVSLSLAELPIALALGTGVGVLLGACLNRVFQRFDPRATKRTLILLCLGILLLVLEDTLKNRFPFSGLMAVMSLAFVILDRSEKFARELSLKLSKIWVFAEILLFVLLGSQVDPAALKGNLVGIVVIGAGLIARSLGVGLALLRTQLNVRERLFCAVAFIPKASVQAAIAATPLALGLPGGETILAVAIMAIVLTAPLGAISIQQLAPRWLTQDKVTQREEKSAQGVDG